MFRQARISLKRVVELLHDSPTETLVQCRKLDLTAPSASIPLLSVSEEDRLERIEMIEVSYRYPGSRNGISEINLSVDRGALVAITGAVGSGKSTLIRVLLGLLPCDSGSIQWNGRNVQDSSDLFTPPKIAYTPQLPKVFSQSLRDNILLGLTEESVGIDEAVYAAVMEKDIESILEQGLQTFVGRGGVKLSGGQLYRTAAARMFVRNAELVVLEDPARALDIHTEALLWERLLAKDSLTAIVVTHRRSTLQKADHVVVLQDGKIESQGSLERLLSESSVIQHLWRS